MGSLVPHEYPTYAPIPRPDLVEAVLEGCSPTRLTVAELTDHLPWDWNEQRHGFAVVPGANRASS